MQEIRGSPAGVATRPGLQYLVTGPGAGNVALLRERAVGMKEPVVSAPVWGSGS